ncbi:MAG TPA: site-2 protease family protein [Candidatus Saccharimonadales bacterium]|nr:site-2 protease family protein [Candidatus Saccharimonadales bacterium]
MNFRGTNLVEVLIILIFSITVHEMMHAFTAHWLGDDTAHREGRLTLNPLAHIDPFLTIVMPAITLFLFGVPFLAAKPVPFNPNRVKYDEFGAALVGLAGPLTNLTLAILGAIVLRGLGSGVTIGVFNFLTAFVALNVAIFVFNMIPIPPLDGSRVLYAFAPESIQNVMAQMEQFGIFIVLVLIVAVPALSTILVNIDDYIFHILTGLRLV